MIVKLTYDLGQWFVGTTDLLLPDDMAVESVEELVRRSFRRTIEGLLDEYLEKLRVGSSDREPRGLL